MEWNNIIDEIHQNIGDKDIRKDKNVNQLNQNDQYQPCDTFESMGLKENLLRGIYTYGFERPSRIQQYTIPIIKSRRDLIAQSQSGTGKTGSFTSGVLQIIDETKKYPQAIIIAPTRELSQQIEYVAQELGKFLKINTALSVGGTKVSENIERVRNAHIIIGTPGRVYDMMERDAFDIDKITCMVMDEADQLLDRDFVNQTKNIIKKLAPETQICAFSATLSEAALAITNKFMQNPENLLIKKENLSLDLISQYRVDVGEERYKLESLNDIYERLSIGQCIIYVNYKGMANVLQQKLKNMGHSAVAIHGDLSPIERNEIMKRFRHGEYRVLIATDLLARGIDVQQVSYVINYDIPDVENYLHRIGRSGRFGKKGVAINFITKRDIRAFKTIEDHYKIKIEPMPEPDELNDYLKH